MASAEALAAQVAELKTRLAVQEDLMNQASTEHAEGQARLALAEEHSQRMATALDELTGKSE